MSIEPGAPAIIPGKAEMILQFRDADPELLGKVVGRRNIVDGRNALDPARWRAASWYYRALGRP